MILVKNFNIELKVPFVEEEINEENGARWMRRDPGTSSG